MSDLINRKALLEDLKTHFDAEYNEDGRLLYSDHICTGEDVEDLIKLVNAQPTAYDIGEIMDKLARVSHRVETHQYGSERVVRLLDAVYIVNNVYEKVYPKGGPRENSNV